MEETTFPSRSVSIQGKSNRYMMRKAMKISTRGEKRKGCKIEPMDHAAQLALLSLLSSTEENSNETVKFVEKELAAKLCGYKHQDMDKNIYDGNLFLSTKSLHTLLNDSKLLCYYCQQPVQLVYDTVREGSQWTLDREDNSRGHNENNVVIACLTCNLQRRRQDKDAFHFSKNVTVQRLS